MSVDLSALGALADDNLAASWSSFGRSAGASFGASDTCSFVATGAPVAFFNGAFTTGPVADCERVVDDLITFMAAQQVPFLLWVRDGVDDALLDAGRRAGLRDAGGPPAMALPSIPPSPAPPTGLDFEVIADVAGMTVFRDVVERGFEMPSEIVNLFFVDEMIDSDSITILVGSVGDTPVTCASVVVSGTTAGIYNVATPAEHRRRGYGEAATWAAIEYGARQGCDHAILQASDLGAPVYRSMGFVDVGSYVQLEGPPTPNS